MKVKRAKSADFKAQAMPQLESLYRVASYVLESDSEAQDLVKESLIKAYHSWQTSQFRPSSRVGLFKVMVGAYIKQYRPFPTLSTAINSVDTVRADIISTQSANPQAVSRGAHDAIRNHFPSGNSNGQSHSTSQACRPSALQSGDGVKRATTLTFNDAINNAFEFDGTWEQLDQERAKSSIQEYGYRSKAGSNYQIETNSNSSESKPAVSIVNFNFNMISGEAVKKAIRTLPDDIRLIVVLSLLEDFSHSEIADIVGVHLETVKSRLPEGRRLIRESLYSVESRVSCTTTTDRVRSKRTGSN